MLIWLIVVAAFALFWGALWKNYTQMAVGALIGMPVGWFISGPVQSYLSGDMHDIPLWLPPLPFAIVALLLLVVGGIIWFGPNDADTASSAESHDDKQHH